MVSQMAHAKILGEPFMAHLENLYNIPCIIYLQEGSGQHHIDQYRSKLYSLYTSNDRL